MHFLFEIAYKSVSSIVCFNRNFNSYIFCSSGGGNSKPPKKTDSWSVVCPISSAPPTPAQEDDSSLASELLSVVAPAFCVEEEEEESKSVTGVQDDPNLFKSWSNVTESVEQIPSECPSRSSVSTSSVISGVPWTASTVPSRFGNFRHHFLLSRATRLITNRSEEFDSDADKKHHVSESHQIVSEKIVSSGGGGDTGPCIRQESKAYHQSQSVGTGEAQQHRTFIIGEPAVGREHLSCMTETTQFLHQPALSTGYSVSQHPQQTGSQLYHPGCHHPIISSSSTSLPTAAPPQVILHQMNPTMNRPTGPPPNGPRVVSDNRDYAADLNRVASAAYSKALNDAARIQMMAAAQSSWACMPHQQPIIIQNTTKAIAESQNETSTTMNPSPTPPPSSLEKLIDCFIVFWKSRLNRLLVFGVTGMMGYIYWEWWQHKKRLELMQRRIEANPFLRLSQLLSVSSDKHRPYSSTFF